MEYSLVKILSGEVTPVVENVSSDELLKAIDDSKVDNYYYVVSGTTVTPVTKFLLNCLSSALQVAA
jgi:hypothetical protein